MSFRKSDILSTGTGYVIMTRSNEKKSFIIHRETETQLLIIEFEGKLEILDNSNSASQSEYLE